MKNKFFPIQICEFVRHIFGDAVLSQLGTNSNDPNKQDAKLTMLELAFTIGAFIKPKAMIDSF